MSKNNNNNENNNTDIQIQTFNEANLKVIMPMKRIHGAMLTRTLNNHKKW